MTSDQSKFVYSEPMLKSLYAMDSQSVEEIKNEPMLFSSDIETALRLGGPITKEFVARLIEWSSENWIIDSRVHMLMPGWYPCIPGWHHDDVPRSREDGQPNYRNPEYRSVHVSAVLDAGTGSLTQFLDMKMLLEEPPLGAKIYKHWNDDINNCGILQTQSVESGEVLMFNDRTFHRGMPATGFGWRFFIRASMGTDRRFYNEQRNQVQVYLHTLEDGW